MTEQTNKQPKIEMVNETIYGGLHIHIKKDGTIKIYANSAKWSVDIDDEHNCAHIYHHCEA